MALLTTDEIENLRFHLGFGNLQVGAYPYTPDGFFELFTNIVQPYLSDASLTSSTTAIDASNGSLVVVVTPLDMTDIVMNQRLIVDNDDDAELVTVKAITGTTFTAKFKYSHGSTGYPVAVATGTSRIRYLLTRADKLHEAMFGDLVTAVAGLQSADKGEVVWIGRSSVLKAQYDQYRAIIGQIGSLIRVEPLSGATGPATRLEAY